MKSVLKITVWVIIAGQVLSQGIFSTEPGSCSYDEDVIKDYQKSMYEFANSAYKKIAPENFHHFVFAPLSGWLILAAIAEATDINTKQAIFQQFNIPEDPCIRLKYYKIATSRFISSEFVNITSTRVLVIDEEVTMNPVYHNFIFQNFLLDVVSAPMRRDPQTTLEEIRRITGAKVPTLDLSGNSVILDAVAYSGIWASAFEDAVVEKAPFYSQSGEKIGSVDLMRIKKRVKTSYLQSIQVKTVELSIGSNDCYRLIFCLPVDNNLERTVVDVETSIIDEYVNNRKESEVPIEIAIPRMNLTSEYEVRSLLANFGLQNLWTEPTVTRLISEPAALPSGFVQRATISLNNVGLYPVPQDIQYPKQSSTPLDPIIGGEFIANRPFFFVLMDSETHVTIMAGAFSQPTYY